MISSMTGFATASAECALGVITVELRSVNNRFLDAVLRLPDEFRPFEPALREKLAGKVVRGKVEVRVGLAARTDATPSLDMNEGVIAALLNAERRILSLADGARGLSVADILRWPGVLASDTVDPQSLGQPLLTAFDTALNDFVATRRREGDKLASLLRERVARIAALAKELAPQVPEAVAAQREKLIERLKEALGTVDDNRLAQEVALFAQKIDVDEELDRLQTHCTEVTRVLDAGGSVGKRLDFLMQELHREANTLGSKVINMQFTQASLECKVLIEQMREQVQNLE